MAAEAASELWGRPEVRVISVVRRSHGRGRPTGELTSAPAGPTAGAALVDEQDIRGHFAAVGFTAPVQEARTFWHALHDVADASAELSFYRHDQHGQSIDTEAIRISLAPLTSSGVGSHGS